MTDYQAFLAEVGLTEEQMEAAAARESHIPSGCFDVEFRPSPIHGTGMFSRVHFQRGQPIASARIGGDWTDAGRFANHAQDANMWCEREPNGLRFVAQRLIHPGEELTVNYRSVGSAMKIQPINHHV
jgi:hypothetical protein